MKVLMILVILGIVASHTGAHLKFRRRKLSERRNCVSKFYNRELGPLEILMLPLGEKLWLRAWFGLHVTNLLDMQGVDVAEVTQLVVPSDNHNRTKRSSNQHSDIANDARLPRNVIPNSYRLELRPLMTDAFFQGRVRINMTCLNSTDRIILHAHDDLRVNVPGMAVRRIGGKESITRNTYIREMNDTHRYDRYNSIPEDVLKISKIIRGSKKSWYEIVLTDKLTKGAIYEVDLLFSGILNNSSREAFYLGSYKENQTSSSIWFMATQMKQGNARRVFPCFDEPGYKAIFEVSVARATDMTVLTTMPLQNSEWMGKESYWKWDRFQVTPPMSTSSILIFIYKTNSLLQVLPTERGYINVRGFALASDSLFVQATMDHLALGIDYLERYLGVPFPLPQLNVVFLPNVSSSAEDYWGFFMVRNHLQSASLFHVLRQWFGHLVTAEWWTENVLSTSLAQYHAYICPLEVVQGCEMYRTPMWGPRYGYAGVQHETNDIPSLKQIQLHKIIWFLRMLNFTISETTFRKGIQTFLEDRAYNTFIENDLWNAIDMEAWKDNTLDKSVSIQQVAKSWLTKDRFPIITITRNYSNNSADIEQHVFLRRSSNAITSQEQSLWWVPIVYLSQEHLESGNLSTVVWMKEERHMKIFNLPGPQSFIFMNFEEIGLFIVSYDPVNWNLLSEYLISSASGSGETLLPIEVRAKLLHDAWLLALGGELNFTIALNMTLFMKYETDYSLWLNFHSLCIEFSKELDKSSSEWKFELYIRKLFTPIYESLETTKDEEGSSSFRVIADAVMHRMGYDKFVEENSAEFNRWLLMDERESENLYVDFCAVFRWGYAKDWEQGRRKLIQMLSEENNTSKQAQLLEALISCPRDSQKTERILEMMLLEDYDFSPREMKQAFDAVSGMSAFFNFLSRNWNIIKQRFANDTNMWMYMIQKATEGFKSQDGYNLVYEMYVLHKHELESALPLVEQSLAAIRKNMKGLHRYLPFIEEWLDLHLTAESSTVST